MLLPSLLATLVAAGAPESSGGRGMIPHERYTLDNGLDVVLHHDDRIPLVAVRVVYHVGSMHDPPGKEGAAHLLEHAMFSGSTHVPDGGHFGSLAIAGATGVNAFTAYEYTAYVEQVSAIQLDVALWLESDRMGFFDVRLHRRSVKQEQAIVTQEITQRRQRDALSDEASELWDLLAPQGHPLHVQDVGSLEHVTLDDLATMAQRHYGPANATLILAGALPPDIRDRVDHWFGSLQGGTRRALPRIPPLELASNRQKIVRSDRVSAPAVLVAWPSPGVYEPWNAEANVLARILDSRGRAGISASIASASATQMELVGQSILFVRLEGWPGTAPQALLSELDGVLDAIARGELTELEFRAAARRSIVAFHRTLGSLQGRTDRMTSYIVAGKPADWTTRDLERYQRTTKNGISTFVGKFLAGRPRAAVLVVPTGGSR
jgi:zinc protease